MDDNIINVDDNINDSYTTSKIPISRQQLELALIHSPRVTGYYFFYKNLCMITFKDQIYTISYSEDKECPIWSKTPELFICLDLDDGFFCHNPFVNEESDKKDGYPMKTILDSFNQHFDQWKNNRMEGDILARDDSHLF
ncbi:hypothetical protein Catovirus_1_489 [Catovirus CTV1]|uniref:Uncharacterized protein n=1 Tax=Catovirus CTV1 TaxID=1977631 RepID=A0A1V0S9S0_9VIRU|nr:hypothetical protein Catovirus_1_489 [Catovirus CTV1]